MKVYTYRPEEANLTEWPAGELRLEGTIPVTSAAEADVFVYPGAIHALTAKALRRLPYWSHEEKHVFFHCADHETLYDTTAIVIRCNTRDWYFPRDPNTVSWPWPVEDFAEWVDAPPKGFKFDVSFHGWRSSKVRAASVDSIKLDALRSFSIAEYPDFCGYIYDTHEGRRRRAAFRESMQFSRVALCPESIPGVLPYRFFEAMSAGRVPFLVGSNYVLPQAHLIPYSEFCLFCPAESAGGVAATLADFLKKHSDAELIETGRKARHYWQSFLNRDHWPALMTEAVRQRLAL